MNDKTKEMMKKIDEEWEDLRQIALGIHSDLKDIAVLAKDMQIKVPIRWERADYWASDRFYITIEDMEYNFHSIMGLKRINGEKEFPISKAKKAVQETKEWIENFNPNN